ncbi:hypothetical protein CEXT_633461 [Caerostris extrusa]|uniref:Uncharacterized protein n=1 Tax=Caerostris extrusa TaxID=172846 RepID=A0AAV4XQQ2_CAEEX|nr:hypothetical protein CEXT_633461 [Caerostris extrusa]
MLEIELNFSPVPKAPVSMPKWASQNLVGWNVPFILHEKKGRKEHSTFSNATLVTTSFQNLLYLGQKADNRSCLQLLFSKHGASPES